MPVEFLTFIINNGCKYLNLFKSVIIGTELKLKKISQLRYLDICYCKAGEEVLEELLGSCQYLQKLSTDTIVDRVFIQNGKSLQTLELKWTSGMTLETIQLITRLYILGCQLSLI